MADDTTSTEFPWLQQSDTGASHSQVGQQVLGQQANPVTHNVASNSPIYVNARQYARILKRRQARLLLETRKKTIARQQFLHESRHKHACKRPRGPQGRFLTKEELEQRRLAEEQKTQDGESVGRDRSDGISPSNSTMSGEQHLARPNRAASESTETSGRVHVATLSEVDI